MESVEILPKLSEEDTSTVPTPPTKAKGTAFEENTFNIVPLLPPILSMPSTITLILKPLPMCPAPKASISEM